MKWGPMTFAEFLLGREKRVSFILVYSNFETTTALHRHRGGLMQVF